MENLRQAQHSGRTRIIGILLLAAILLLLVGSAGAAPEKTPQFINPLDGSIVQGTVDVLIFAPEYAQYHAEFGVDGDKWRPMLSKGDGVFSLDWNSAEASHGKHALLARFYYGGDRPPVAAISITVWVNNESPGGQAGSASVLPLPCIQVMTAYGLIPSNCAAPATS
jgi:hypothetical protein